MKTPFDFASVLLFAVIAVIYLHRSSKEGRDPVPLWAYALTAIACAAGDVLANRDYILPGAALLVAAIGGTIWIAFRKAPEIGKAR